MLARVYHRAVARGTALRLVAAGEKVLRVLSLTGQPAPGEAAAPDASGTGAARDRALIGEMVDRLSGVGRILEESAAQAGVPLASQLGQAIEELGAIIQAARTGITPPRRAGEADA